MKEIKFRGFHPCEDGRDICVIDGKEIRGRWVCGDFCCPCNIITEEIGYDKELMQDGVPVIGDYNVIRETVGMFVREDIYGKPIFEGDVIEYAEGRGFVYYDEEDCSFIVLEEDNRARFVGGIELPRVVGKREFESGELAEGSYSGSEAVLIYEGDGKDP